MEVFRLDPEGRISEFWALKRDTVAFDEFFSLGDTKRYSPLIPEMTHAPRKHGPLQRPLEA